MSSHDSPLNVEALYQGVDQALNTPAANGEPVGDCKWGVYLFYNYDAEPIYVGQTKERLRTRIRRHLTNQRTDAVAMSVLDPFEVAEIEMWPFWEEPTRDFLDQAEFTAYSNAIEQASFEAMFNEKTPRETEQIEMPESVRCSSSH